MLSINTSKIIRFMFLSMSAVIGKHWDYIPAEVQ